MGDDGPERGAVLSEEEIDFIHARNSFYLASVSETGWPHVQHRGGPVGFARVLDARTIAWVDFIGNRQYVSLGNVTQNDRVALILIDYPRRRRLKIFGHMAWFEADQQPDLIQSLSTPGYHARAEHVAQVIVEAFDWNCSQHITPRYSLDEIGAGFAVPI